MKTIYKKGQTFGAYTLIKLLGGGGNGEVWTCQNSKGETFAIKLLKKIKATPYTRFIDETTVLEQNKDIVGILPVIDKHLPTILHGNTPYFIMPVAAPSEEKLNTKSIEEKVDAVIQVAETLSDLHERKIYHRDIKPPNILFYDGRFVLADFGLVAYPHKKEISAKNEEIGAKWTMAPEMKRESSTADASKADVYSLAKTLWIYLTGNKKAFDGQYSTESIIHLKKFYPDSYTSPIDNLLVACTDNDPIKRPTIDEFISALRDWRDLITDFNQTNQEQWFEIQTKLFPTSIPARVIWEDMHDIIKVLKVICQYKDLNHMFFPNGGGLDLEDARLSYEDGCLELDFRLIDIVKPKRLIFESFGYDHEWNYFRLELDTLEVSEENTVAGEEAYDNQHDHEALSELTPANYYPYYIMNDPSSYRDHYPITKFSRTVTRWFRGNFVIFSKSSPYNQATSTYDGRHNKMSTDEFREYIQRNVDHAKELEDKKPIFEKLFDKSNRRQVERRKSKTVPSPKWEEIDSDD